MKVARKVVNELNGEFRLKTRSNSQQWSFGFVVELCGNEGEHVRIGRGWTQRFLSS